MTYYIMLFIIGLVLQIGSVCGAFYSNRMVDKKTTEKVVYRVIDNKTGEILSERGYSSVDVTKWKIVKRRQK